MRRTDADLAAVRELPPGMTEPSAEALARVWARIGERSAPQRSWRQRSWWPDPRLWTPIAAAAVVLALVGVGVLMLRPRPQSLPAVTGLTSDPATVTRVIDELNDATRTTGQQLVATGQLFYMRSWTVPGAQACESWVRPADLGFIYRQCDDGGQQPGLLGARRFEEAAGDLGRTGSDPARPDSAEISVRDYVDPAAIRARFILARNDLPDASDDLKVWTGLQTAIWPGRFAPVDRRVALHRVMAGLPLSVGKTEQDGHRLVVVRFAEDGIASDLLFDPGTGLPEGWQTTGPGPAGSAEASLEPAMKASHEPYVVSDEGGSTPSGYERVLRSIDVVEAVGDRP